jgi:site-specific DNA-methyltransferase (adenine-specific)
LIGYLKRKSQRKKQEKGVGIKILHGSCLDRLKDLEDQSINTCITSPPYWGLRDYGEGEQLGLEETPEAFVENLVKVFREVKRVLRDDGTVWLNLGDSYSSGGRTTTTNQTLRGDKDYGVTRPKPSEGIKPKDLIGIPWRVAFALQADGWYLRQDIIWHKPNPMPESVRDRCTKAHEYIFLLSKSPKYYFDNEAIKEDGVSKGVADSPGSIKAVDGVGGSRDNIGKFKGSSKRNKRSVWTITTKPFKGAHFATFPMDLIEPCVLAGCPEKVCVECNEPYVRQVESKRIMRNELPKDDPRYRPKVYETAYEDINGKVSGGYTATKDLGLQKQCDCKTNETKSGIVLDPFGGSGTTAQVANSHNRDAILIELNEEYIEIAKERIAPDGDLFTEIEVF